MAGLQAFMSAIRFRESSNNYSAQNGSFYGAYQFGDLAFKDTGYMNSDGTWTGKNDIQAGIGDDKFFGFGGNDTFFGGSGGEDFLDGGGRHRYVGL